MLFVWHRDAGDAQESLRSEAGLRQTATAIPVLKIPVITVDANDAVAVYRVASESINRARMGRGPTLIECSGMRNGSGNEAANGENSADHDPISNMETYLTRKGLFRAEMKREIATEFRSQLDAATRFLNELVQDVAREWTLCIQLLRIQLGSKSSKSKGLKKSE